MDEQPQLELRIGNGSLDSAPGPREDSDTPGLEGLDAPRP